MIIKKDLNELQIKKLTLAAGILHRTAALFDGTQSLLPLWGGGVITHGIPKIKKCVIGITEDAKRAHKKDTTNDHLYRVTETAKFVIGKNKKLGRKRPSFRRTLTVARLSRLFPLSLVDPVRIDE